MPLDYASGKHRGFAFVEFETVEDAAAAVDNMVKYFFNYKIHFTF
jgi:peptidyl-prolyl isomerase E (cyclophilin E)